MGCHACLHIVALLNSRDFLKLSKTDVLIPLHLRGLLLELSLSRSSTLLKVLIGDEGGASLLAKSLTIKPWSLIRDGLDRIGALVTNIFIGGAISVKESDLGLSVHIVVEIVVLDELIKADFTVQSVTLLVAQVIHL